jgi:hypothetical protein
MTIARSYAIRFHRIGERPGPGSVLYTAMYYTGGYPVYKPVPFLRPSTDYWEVLSQLRPLQEIEHRRLRQELYGDRALHHFHASPPGSDAGCRFGCTPYNFQLSYNRRRVITFVITPWWNIISDKLSTGQSGQTGHPLPLSTG